MKNQAMEFTKKAPILNLIKTRIYNKNPKAEIFLFGSRARNEENINSDWDILILVEAFSREIEKELREEIFEIELSTGEAISTFVFSKQDWFIRHAQTPFFQNIQREGIKI